MAFKSDWSGPGASFIATSGGNDLACMLQEAMRRVPVLSVAWVVLGWRMLRRGGIVDAVVATDRAALAILFRPGAARFTAMDRAAAEDAALDLADFHAGSRGVPVLPVVLIPNGVQARPQFALPLAGAAPAIEATRLTLPLLLAQVAGFPTAGLQGAAWAQSAYLPVAGLLEAAGMLYAHHGNARLRLAAAGPAGLRRTQAAMAKAIAGEGRRIVFVTGAPGAGKTLCGLDLAFAPGGGAAFLTGNPSLVHVLRESLVRDAIAAGLARRAAIRRVGAVIQALPAFRDAYVASGQAPSERVLVIDEAQRCWSREYAMRKTRNGDIALSDSEPGHLLDIAARRSDGTVLVCLVGGGQEIHDGEGGLAAWGEALRQRPGWTVFAPPAVSAAARQVLPALPGLTLDPDLHLAAPVRAVRAPDMAEWVDAMLGDDPARAARIAGSAPLPFVLTRSLPATRRALRPVARRSAGLVASSTARRLRAEGLGAVLAHQDEDAVSRWFLDRWPDIRSGDALEMVASEFAVQGLELDQVGVCWDLDLVRGEGWRGRRFRGSAWTSASAEATENRRNAYRVLLTRGRHRTVIWVPCGEAADATRDPTLYNAIAAYLTQCGVPALDAAAAGAQDAAVPEPALL